MRASATVKELDVARQTLMRFKRDNIDDTQESLSRLATRRRASEQNGARHTHTHTRTQCAPNKLQTSWAYWPLGDAAGASERERVKVAEKDKKVFSPFLPNRKQALTFDRRVCVCVCVPAPGECVSRIPPVARDRN